MISTNYGLWGRIGDTVYVLRDILNPQTNVRHTFKTIKNFKFSDCDIFRVERLWKSERYAIACFLFYFLISCIRR